MMKFPLISVVPNNLDTSHFSFGAMVGGGGGAWVVIGVSLPSQAEGATEIKCLESDPKEPGQVQKLSTDKKSTIFELSS